jgi:hypothetical protein
MKGRLFISLFVVALGLLTVPSKADSEFKQLTLDRQHYRVTIATGYGEEFFLITCDGIGNYIEVDREMYVGSALLRPAAVILKLSGSDFPVSAEPGRVIDDLVLRNGQIVRQRKRASFRGSIVEGNNIGAGDIVEHQKFLLALLHSNTLDVTWDGANLKFSATEQLRQEFVRNCADVMYMNLD